MLPFVDHPCMNTNDSYFEQWTHHANQISREWDQSNNSFSSSFISQKEDISFSNASSIHSHADHLLLLSRQNSLLPWYLMSFCFVLVVILSIWKLPLLFNQCQASPSSAPTPSKTVLQLWFQLIYPYHKQFIMVFYNPCSSSSLCSLYTIII